MTWLLTVIVELNNRLRPALLPPASTGTGTA